MRRKGALDTRILLGVAAVVFFFVLAIVMTGLSKARQANELEETLKVEEKTYVSTLEKITRVISGKYKIANEYPKQITEVVAALAKGREGGNVFKSVQESSGLPLPPDLQRDVMQAVEANRAEFNNAYKAYGDHAREFNSLIRDPLWGSSGIFGPFFMGKRERIDPDPILSTRTSEAQRTRRSDRSDFDSDFSK